MRYKIENNNIFNDWQFFKIHDVYYELDIIINTNIEKIEIGINEIFNKQANKILTFEGNSYKPDIYSKFKFELRKEEYTEMNNLLGIQSKYSNEYLISSLLYLLIHLFILFPILLTFKSGKKPKGGESLRKLFN